MHAHIMSLQAQVDALWENVNTLRASLGHELLPQYGESYSSADNEAGRSNVAAPQASMIIDPALHRTKESAQHPRPQAAANSAYSSGLARSSLQQLDVSGPEGLAEDGPENGIAAHSKTTAHTAEAFEGFPTKVHPSLHVIASITKEEAIHLCQIYEHELGILYPIVDIKLVKQHAQLVFGLGDAVVKQALIFKGDGESLYDPDFDLLRLVLAIALVRDGSGRIELACRFYESTNNTVVASSEGAVDLKRVQIMTLAVSSLICTAHYKR